MTREEAIDIIKHILEVTPKEPPTECDNVEEWLYEDNEIRKAFDMAIKALEQESILDKIRAEIEKEIIPRNSDQYDHEAMWQNCGLRIALKVIDKYKAESEE